MVLERVEDLDVYLEEGFAGGPFSSIFEYLKFPEQWIELNAQKGYGHFFATSCVVSLGGLACKTQQAKIYLFTRPDHFSWVNRVILSTK